MVPNNEFHTDIYYSDEKQLTVEMAIRYMNLTQNFKSTSSDYMKFMSECLELDISIARRVRLRYLHGEDGENGRKIKQILSYFQLRIIPHKIVWNFCSLLVTEILSNI